MIPTGPTQIKKSMEKRIMASKKFINTQASITIACCQAGFDCKESDAQFSCNFFQISSFIIIETFPPSLSKIFSLFLRAFSRLSLL